MAGIGGRRDTAVGRDSREWDTDLLIKKPWTLSQKVEFMVGVGPEWIHASGYNPETNSSGAEGCAGLHVLALRKHKFGWYLEPAYDHDFGRGHDQSAGISGGLLIAIPWRLC